VGSCLALSTNAVKNRRVRDEPRVSSTSAELLFATVESEKHSERISAPDRSGPKPSERDAQQRVAAALQQRGFTVRQDVGIPGAGRKDAGIGIGRADIFAERGDVRLIVEMKSPERFRTRGQRAKARGQARRYADRLAPLFVATSDGNTLILEDGQERYVHQLVGGTLLSPDDRASPLDLGADYATFSAFPRLQRLRYVFETDATIEREPIFDLGALVAASDCDALLVAGEAGAGKTTYARQVALMAAWDPLWLDGGVIDDPRDALLRAVQELTGFTGDLRTFLDTLQGYRRRDGRAPCGIVVDALDEWSSAQRHLPDLIRFASALGLKVVCFGRARSIDSLLENERLTNGIAVQRRELLQFTDNEQDRAEQEYIKRCDLRSGFVGRAKEMDRLPEMMAMISEAYAGEPINPDLTQRELYDRYRRKKCGDVARRANTEPERIQAEIDAVALAMLEMDSIVVPFGSAAAVANLEGLLLAGVLRKEGDQRRAYVRFRFGRIRDDALADRPLSDLFSRSIVGRSALDYASATDAAVRREYMRLAVADNVLDAMFLTREAGWWREFADLVPSELPARERSLVLGYAGRALAAVPELLVKFAAEPYAARYADVHRVNIPSPTWRGWLNEATDPERLHDVLSFTRRLFAEGHLTLSEAIDAVDLARERLVGERGFADEGYAFWPLVGTICERLDAVAARRFLRRTIPTFALAHSSGGQTGVNHYHGVRYAGDMLKCVASVRARSSPAAFEAWASATLLRAYATEWREHGFDGRELSGSSTTMGRYNDNGWVLDAILPAMQAIVAERPGLSPRLRDYATSRLHPAFRLRAMILASPIVELERLPQTTLGWRRDRRTGIPSVAEALDARAPESAVMREQALDDALERFGMPLSAVQADAFHERLAAGSRRAARQAERFLADPRFHAQDLFNVEFFSRMAWAQRRPMLAVRLVRIAIASGYDRFMLSMQRGYGDVIRLATTRPRLQRMLSDLPGMDDELALALHNMPAAIRARLAQRLYDRAGAAGKRDIIRWAHELPRKAAVRLLRCGLEEDAMTAEVWGQDEDLEHDRIPTGTLHDDVWFALVMCQQRWPKLWFRDLGVDLVERAQRFESPVAVAATVRPIGRYIVEIQKDRAAMERAIDFLLDVGGRGGNNMRDVASETLSGLYPGMTPPQRERFFAEFQMTATIATASMFVARNKPDDRAVVERALWHARSNPHRDQIAGTIWREIHGNERTLTPIESTIVDELVIHADERTVREVSHVASSLSKREPAGATSLLLRVVSRALAIGVHLWQPYEMEYAWADVRSEELQSLARIAADSGNAGWVAVDIIARGLASRTGGGDSTAVHEAFMALSARYESAREHFTQWRRQTATG